MERLRKILAILSSSNAFVSKNDFKNISCGLCFALSEECLLSQDRFHVISGV